MTGDKEKKGVGFRARTAPIAVVLGAVISAVGFILAFTVAPLVNGAQVTPELVAGNMVSNQLLFSQKIFYFHMPTAITSFAALGFTAYFAIRYLMTKDMRYDTCSRIATEVSLVFIICVMCTGESWERFEWGVWWTWEPRLTTYLILMLIVIAYFVLRTAITEPERRAAFSSVFGIIAFIDVPICFMVTRLIPSSTHPVVLRTDAGLSPDMLAALLPSMIGIMLIGYGLYQLRLRQVTTAQRIEEVKVQLEETEGEQDHE